MFYLMVVIFLVGYALIALERPVKVNKSATALLLAVVLWVCIVVAGEAILVDPTEFKHYMESAVGGSFLDWLLHHELLQHLGEISEILFFLLGAMTIVELVDSYQGFRLITDKITTTKRLKLLWVTSILTFFMSAVLDNLTASIVMVALLRTLIHNKHDRWFYAGMVVVAANAGGAWSPIGDITTIMLWISGKVTTLNIIKITIFPSIVSMLVPLIILSFTMKVVVKRPAGEEDKNPRSIPRIQSNAIFFTGLGGLLFVPIFKHLTHLPPYLGIIFSLGVLWVLTEILNYKSKKKGQYTSPTVSGVFQKVDVPSVLFFLGILLAVSSLESAGHLMLLADILREHIGNLYIINIVIGILSAIVDNVALVAGAMGMYNFPPDHYFWMFLAYCAGTGGSLLIIGSAAGIAVMGMEKIDFIWYLKRLSVIVLIGYLAGAGTYIFQEESGILRSKKETSPYVVNIDDNGEIINYLTHNKFYYLESGKELKGHQIENGAMLYFIKFTDRKTGETYLGYQQKRIHDGNEYWEGSLEKTKIAISRIGENTVKVNLLDKTYQLDSQGELLELRMGKQKIQKTIKWRRLVVAEE